MSKIVGLAELQSAIQGKLEPVHETRTVTGSNGSITISNALDAPLLSFSAVGMGAPAVFYIEGDIGSQMGSQSWGAPMMLDVPLAIADGELTPVLTCYGEGVGANSYDPTAGEETGTTVYLNAKELAALFDDAEDEEATVTSEGNYYVYECPLPFSVAANSTVYCSHLVNRNAAGSEGIWADGDTLYLRIGSDHSGGNSFEDLARVMRGIAAKVNWYDIENLKGFDDENLYDFFVCLTASESTTKSGTAKAVKLGSGALSLSYFKISDFIALISEEEPSPTPISSMSATYYLDSAVNRTLRDTVNAALEARFSQAALGSGAEATKVGGAVGAGASATHGAAVGGGAVETRGGAAVGYHASATVGGAAGAYAEETGGGAAVGYQASATIGGAAVGYQASATIGGAVGAGASATTGGAVGSFAHSYVGGAMGQECWAGSGGAVGYGAKTSDGCAIGRDAVCKDSHNDPIDAIQLGTGTNATTKSMQVYGTQLLYYDSTNNTHYIPLSLITASYNAATASEKNDFDLALGNIVRYSITNDLIGASIGTFVKLTSDGTVSEAWEDGDVFIGQLAEVPSSGANTALVRIKGVMETEAMLGLGLQRVAFSDGALDISANGREIFVTSSMI